MKNQYFGDQSDFEKYTLLRKLLIGTKLKLLVAWYLTPNDSGFDGKRRKYLDQPDIYRINDPVLFDFLQKVPRYNPEISFIENSGILPNACFYSVEVPDKDPARNNWQNGLINAAQGTDLVFFDPDNGIEVESKPIGRKGSSKYVSNEEIKAIWKVGCSLLIFQHYNRKPRKTLENSLLRELKKLPGVAFVRPVAATSVLYLLVTQKRHATFFNETSSK